MEIPSAAIVHILPGIEKSAELRLDLFPFGGVDAIAHGGAFHGSAYKAKGFQLFEVLGNGGLGQAQFLDQVAVDALVGAHQILQNGDTRRMPEGLGQRRQFVLSFGEEFSFGDAHDYSF